MSDKSSNSDNRKIIQKRKTNTHTSQVKIFTSLHVELNGKENVTLACKRQDKHACKYLKTK